MQILSPTRPAVMFFGGHPFMTLVRWEYLPSIAKWPKTLNDGPFTQSSRLTVSYLRGLEHLLAKISKSKYTVQLGNNHSDWLKVWKAGGTPVLLKNLKFKRPSLNGLTDSPTRRVVLQGLPCTFCQT